MSTKYTKWPENGHYFATKLLLYTYNRDNQDQYQYVFTLGIVKGHEIEFSEESSLILF